MKRPIPVLHWTVETVSDHRAYLCTFLLPGGETFTVATLNLSIKAVKRQPEQLVRDLIRVYGLADVVLLQEAGAARDLVARAARLAHRDVWFGEGEPGQASTPLIVRRDLVHHFRAFKLHGRRFMGKGAGPEWAKPKWLMVVRLKIDGHQVNIGNVHFSPSTWNPIRAALVLLQARRSSKALARLSGWSFAGGDLNQNALLRVLRLLRPWRRHGLRSSQRRLGPIPTKDRRAIDDIYYPLEEAD